MKKSKMLKVIATILMLTFMIQMVPFSAIAAGDEITDVLDPESIITEIPYDTTSDEKPETKEIVSEETAKRSENEKHFKLEDGSFVIAQYPDAIHYEDENGNWVDIDNTLIAEEATGANDFDGYTNKDNDFNVKLAEDGKDQLLRIEEDDFSISMKLDEENAAQSFIAVENNNNVATITDDMSVEEKNDQTMQLDKLTSKAEYSDILPGIDIEYTVQSNRVKEYIVVNERRDEYVFSFELELGNLVVRENEDGSISLMTSEGEEKYVIPAPYMFDANEQYSDAVSYAITNIGSGKYTLTVTADVEWINDDNTALPVKIDPTIETTDSDAILYDAFVGDNLNYSSIHIDDNTNLRVGYNPTYGNTRTYINWANIADPIGSYVVTSAELKYHLSTPNDFTNDIEVCAVTTEWTDTTISWSDINEHNESPFTYIDASKLKNVGTISIDVTDLIIGCINGEECNGIVLKSSAENTTADTNATNTSVIFVAADATTSIETKPVLCIEYTNQKGIDSNYSYIPIDCGNAGTAYVNLYNGDVAFITPEIEDGPINFNFVYNTYMIYAHDYHDLDLLTESYSQTIVGTCWKLSTLDMIIPISRTEHDNRKISVPVDSDTYAYVYNDKYGTNVYLYAHYDENNEIDYYEDDKNLGYSLTVSNENYTLTKENKDTNDGWTKTFTIETEDPKYINRSVGYMESFDTFTTVNGTKTYTENPIWYDYGRNTFSRIDKIETDSGDNYASHTVIKSSNYLSSISTSAGRSLSLTYGQSDFLAGNLISIHDSDIGTTSFNYDNKDRLISVTAPDGNSLTFDYNNNTDRINYIIWQESNIDPEIKINFSFNRNETLVHYFGTDGADDSTANSTNTDDIYITVGFDENGLSNHIMIEHNEIKTIETIAPYAFRGINSAVINNPNLDIYEYGKANQYVATPFFDHNTNISEMYSIAPLNNTITLSNDAYNGIFSYLVSIDTYRNTMRDNAFLSKQVVLSEGTHTFSAYIKCEDGIKIPTGEMDENEKPIYTAGNIKLSVGTSNYGEVYVTEKTNGWQKLTKTFTLTAPEEYVQDEFISTLYIWFNGVGDIFVDEVMIDNEYLYWPTNYVSSGISSGFEDSVISWDVSSDNTFQRVTNTELYANHGTVSGVEPSNVYEGMYALKIAGEEDKEKSVHYIHYLNNSNRPTKGFTLSGWGKTDSTRPEDAEDYGFELFAYYVYYVDEGEGNIAMRTWSHAISFDPNSTDWQNVSKFLEMPTKANTGEEVTLVYSITFGALYKDATGNAYFDNIELLPVTE